MAKVLFQSVDENSLRRYHRLAMLGFSACVSVVAGPILVMYLSAMGSVAGPQWRYLYYLLLGRLQDQGFTEWHVLTAGFARFVCTIGVFMLLAFIGTTAINFFEYAAQTVSNHRLYFYRWRNIMRTPGQVLDYLIWAYIYATLSITVNVAIYCTFGILIPLSLARNWMEAAGLLFLGFVLAGYLKVLIWPVFVDVYGSVPKRLKNNLRIFGPLVDYIVLKSGENQPSDSQSSR